jgi:hypothetical protein
MKMPYQRGDNFREIGEVEPYQLDASLRGREAVMLYSHLDVDSCSWMFRSFFNMSDLMSKCGGKIATENQASDQFVIYFFGSFHTLYPPITYYWTGVLILYHSYLVENLTNSKIVETKALEPLKS